MGRLVGSDWDSVGKFDHRGNGKWFGTTSLYGRHRESDDHHRGLSARHWDTGRKRHYSAVRVLDEYERAWSSATVCDQREYGGAVQRDKRADFQRVRNVHERIELRAG